MKIAKIETMRMNALEYRVVGIYRTGAVIYRS